MPEQLSCQNQSRPCFSHPIIKYKSENVYLSCFLITEMASKDLLYQSENYVSASIIADYPHAKFFIAKFFDDGFIVSADG